MEVLEKRDAEEVQHEQERVVKQGNERESLQREYGVKRRAVDALEKSKVKVKAGKAKAKAPANRRLPCSISHDEAKQWIPPDCSIWRGLTRGEWHGHCPPYRRTSAPWIRYGQDGAMRVVIKTLWVQYLDKHGLSASDCPIDDLF